MRLEARVIIAALGVALTVGALPQLAQDAEDVRVSVAETLLAGVARDRRAAAQTAFERHEALDRAAATRAREIALAPASRRLALSSSPERLVRESGLRHVLDVHQRIELQRGTLRPEADALDNLRASRSSREAIADPRYTLAATARADAADGWIITVILLAQTLDVPDDLGEWAQEIEVRINEIRRREGLGELASSIELRAAARAHSEDMARRDYFSHTTDEGYGPGDRVRRTGYAFDRVAENIAQSYRSPDPVGSAIDGWLQSPAHREHILDPHLEETGVGIAEGKDSHFLITQVFAEPKAMPNTGGARR